MLKNQIQSEVSILGGPLRTRTRSRKKGTYAHSDDQSWKTSRRRFFRVFSHYRRIGKIHTIPRNCTNQDFKDLGLLFTLILVRLFLLFRNHANFEIHEKNSSHAQIKSSL